MNYQVPRHHIKLLAIIEAASLTGPAKNLLAFCQEARMHQFSHLPLIESSLATFTRNGAKQYANPFVATAAELEIKIRLIGERFRFDTQIMKELCEEARGQAPDIIQTHNVKSHFLMRLSGLWRNRKWIAFHHGYTTTDVKMRAYNQMDRWSLRKADLVVTMNNTFADQMQSVGVKRHKIRVIHNAVDVEEFSRVDVDEMQALKSALRISVEDRVMIVVGRLSLEKGHIDLIRAYTQMTRLHSDLQTKLVIVGDGPERQRLEGEAASSGLKDQVVFAGQVANVKPYYAMADLVVLPSHSEGSPNALLEAMAARVPIVATAVGGVPEIATDQQTALLVKARDIGALAQAMSNLLQDSKLAARLAANAFAHVKHNYSPETRLRGLLEIYKEIVPGKTSCEAQFV